MTENDGIAHAGHAAARTDIPTDDPMQQPIIGCGWRPHLLDTGREQPTPENKLPCCARTGHLTPYMADGPNVTVGAVGLCTGCLEAPADLLHQLSRSIHRDLDRNGADCD